MSNVDVELVYGVAGGGELSGASGQAILKSLQRIVKNLEKSKIPTIKIFFDGADLKTKIKAIKEKITKTLKEGGKLQVDVTAKGLSADKTKEIKESSNQIKEQTKTYNNFAKQIKDFYKQDAANAKTRYKNLDIQKQKTEQLQAATQKLQQTYRNIGEAQYNQTISTPQAQSLGELQSDLQTNNDLMKQEELESVISVYNKYVAKVGQFIERMEKQGLATDEARQKLQDLKTLMQQPISFDASKDVTTNLENMKSQLSELQKMDLQTQSELYKSGATEPTVLGTFLKALKNKLQSMLSATLIATASRALMQVYNNIVKIDSAMTQLRIVTKATTKQYQEFGEEATKAARKLGIAIDDLIKSTTTYARLGFSLEDSSIFAQLTTMYSNVTGIDVGEATTNITAIIKAYNIAAEDAESVLDKLIEVGNNYAISSAELGEAMNNAASILASNGNSLEEALGILAAANATLQNVSKSSTAVRTIIARISASSADLEELGEDTTGLLTTANLQAEMQAFGVSIVDANGELHSTYDILNDLAKRWDELNSVEQAAIANMLAGTRQQTAFYSIMENWQDATGAVEDCNRATGTLAESYDIYLNSIEGKLGQLTASWQEFSANILDSEIVKFFVDVVKAVADALNFILSFGNGFVVTATLIGVTVAMIISMISKTFGGGLKTFQDFVAAVQLGAEQIGKAFVNLAKNPYMWLTLLITLMATVQNKTAKFVIALVALIGTIVMAIVAGIKAIDGATKSFMATNPIGWVLLAVTALIAVVKTLSDLLQGVSYEDLKEAAKESKDAWKEAADQVDEVTSKLDELQQKIDELNSKQSLTLVDQQQLQALEQEKALLEQELQLQEDAAEQAEKRAAKDAQAAMDKYASQHTRSGYKWWQWLLNPFWAAGELIADNASDTQSEKLNKILSNWQGSSSGDKEYVTNYLKELQELTDGFSYYMGDNLEDWQVQMNGYLDAYYNTLDRYTIANGNIATAWESIFARVKFSDATSTLKDLASEINVTADSLMDLYNSDDSIKQFIDYLTKLGLFAWDDANKVQGLVQQIRDLYDIPYTSNRGYLDILDSIGESYDKIHDLVEEMEDSGIISADTINDLFKDAPALAKKLEELGILSKGEDGYTVSDNALKTYLDDKKAEYDEAIQQAQELYDKIVETYGENSEEAKRAQESLENTQANKRELDIVINTLEKPDLLDRYVEMLEKHSDTLDEQLDKYKDIVDIRKDLLQTYEDELEYQKSLAEKQKNVADLQTQLRLAQLDTSAAGRARARELQQSLNDAQEDLDEYTLEHAIDELSDELDSQYDEYEKFIDEQIREIEETIDRAARLTTDALREALQNGVIAETHHSGGFVGGAATIKSNEQFAKLLQGEYVTTPQQMTNFMNKTLPSIAMPKGGTNSVNYNSPLIAIQCDSITKDSIPQLEKVIDKAVKEVKRQINSSYSRSGKTKSVDKFKI